MPTTTGYSVGDVVLVPFPFTDQTTTKKRPAVVVSSDAYHRERSDIILMAVTSQERPTATVGEASIVAWQAAGLLKPSVLKPLLATFEQRLDSKHLGRLDDRDLDTLRGSLRAIIGA
jgi:mRNA interferase MazF